MALEGDTVDVQLSGLDQKSTTAGAVPGELVTLINARAQKYTVAAAGLTPTKEHLRIEKREGFTRLSQAVRNPLSGASISTTASVPAASFLDTREDQLVAIGSDGVPYVYEPEQPCWEKYAALQLTNVLTRNPVYTPNAQISSPDAASIGNVFMRVWSEGGACKGETVNKDGTLIRTPFTIQSAGRIKVVADGVRFWVVTDNATTNAVLSVYDTNGLLLSSGTVITVLRSSTTPWDIQAMPGTGNGMVIASNASIGVDYARIAFATWSAGPVITGPIFDDRFPMTYAVSFLRSDDALHLYIAVSVQFAYTPPGPDPVRNPGLYIGKLNLDGSHNALIIADNTLTAAEARSVANITGYATSGGDVQIAATFLSTDTRNNSIRSIFIASGGSASAAAVKRSVSLASREFVVGSRHVVAVYYSSQQSAIDVLFGLTFRQATFFLLDIGTQHIVGRFDYGTAAMVWVSVGWAPTDVYPAGSSQLPSPFIDSDLSIHLTLGYRATASASRYATLAQAQFLAANAPAFYQASWAANLFTQFTNTIGIIDVALSIEAGTGVEFNELLLPGTIATSFSGQDFGESNINLAPERPIGITVGGGGLTAGETYRLTIVYEWTNGAGQRVKSAPCVPLEMPMGPDTKISLTSIPTVRVTEHSNVMVSVYMSYMVNGIMSTALAKATDDLVPLYNSTTVDFVSWDTGTLTDAAISVGEPLYTDGNPGRLANYPAPPFSSGCQAWNRAFVVGHDGAVWFSFEDTEVSALGFNPFFRILPPNEPFTKVANLDAFLLIGSKKGWYVFERGSLPDATGAGTIPFPTRLPFPNGVNGAIEVTRDGLFYASTAGGIWLITRDLRNIYIGDKAEDYTAPAFPATTTPTVIAMASDDSQRLIASLASGKFVVWDPNPQLWGRWDPSPLATSRPPVTTWRGKFAFADATDVRIQVAGSYADIGDTNAPILTSFSTAPIHLAGVKNFKRVWDQQIYGQYYGAHTLTVTVTQDDETTPTIATYTFTPDPTAPYQYQLPPKIELCTSVAFAFADSCVSATRGFALELISLYVGLEKGLARVPIARRIAPTG